MNIFKKYEQDELAFSKFLAKVDNITENLKPYADCVDLNQLTKIRNDFKAKTDDFYREDRKLNIGVIGQVKAGKSTFLNTLLFGGKNILPSAATPKTATLTKIEHAEENSIEIEYYTNDEWRILEENATVDSAENEFAVAREIIKMINQSNINPGEYTSKGKECFAFKSPDELMLRLNDYVGENGKFTPVVKNVVIKLSRDELKDISVIDTPGLNDAIASRTDKTRQFIDKCNVVFFLSRGSQFLDSNDMKLLRNQLPQACVARIILVSSRFDNSVSDVLLDFNDIKSAIANTRSKLTTRASEILSKYNGDEIFGNVVKAINMPIFVSSMFENMKGKTLEEFNRDERFYYNGLNEYDDLTPEIVSEIGNFSPVRVVFDEVVEKKDDELSQTARSFVPSAEKALKDSVNLMKQTTEKYLNILKTQDADSLENQKKVVTSQINSIKGNIESVFGEMEVHLEHAKMETVKSLRDLRNDCSTLQDRTGTETHVNYYRVSDLNFCIQIRGEKATESRIHMKPHTHISIPQMRSKIYGDFLQKLARRLKKHFTKRLIFRQQSVNC